MMKIGSVKDMRKTFIDVKKILLTYKNWKERCQTGEENWMRKILSKVLKPSGQPLN